MRAIDLSFFKKFFLFVLVSLINVVYNTNLSAYTTQAAKNGACTASTTGWSCRRISSWGESYIQGPVSLYNTAVQNQACLCLSTAELNSATNCRQAASGGPKPCSAMYTGTNTSRGYIYYDVVAKSCNGTLNCYCAAGYYAANSKTCSRCTGSYYCTGNGTGVMVSQVNLPLASSTACPSPGTTAGGATNISNCYIPANTVITESGTGHTYDYTSNCYYAS